MKTAANFLAVTVSALAQRNPGHPLEHLPANIEIITHFRRARR